MTREEHIRLLEVGLQAAAAHGRSEALEFSRRISELQADSEAAELMERLVAMEGALDRLKQSVNHIVSRTNSMDAQLGHPGETSTVEHRLTVLAEDVAGLRAGLRATLDRLEARQVIRDLHGQLSKLLAETGA